METMIAMLLVAVVTGLLFLERENTISGSTSKLGLLFLLVLRPSFEAVAGLVGLFTERPVLYRYATFYYNSL